MCLILDSNLHIKVFFFLGGTVLWKSCLLDNKSDTFEAKSSCRAASLGLSLRLELL